MNGPALSPPLAPPRGSRLAVELGLFAALAIFGLVQWARLFEAPPTAGFAAVLAIVLSGGIALCLIAGTESRGRRKTALGLPVALLTIAGALVAIGLPLRMLAPANWDELGANLGDGLAAIEDTALPSSGEEVWPRLTLLLGAPLLLGLAAAFAFWPTRRSAIPRIVGLIFLVSLYAVAVTLDSPGSELLWGVPLLLLAVAWLWLPELSPRRGLAALAIAAGAGVVALPAAAALDGERPWLDYTNWDWFAGAQEVSFEWNHSYGPLDWPQVGTPLLSIESDRPLYWKTSVLDRFDGFTWQRAADDDVLAAAEIEARTAGPAPRVLAGRNPEWRQQATFEVLGLRSGLLVGAGTPLALEGIDSALPSADGTVLLADDALTNGDSYGLTFYSPQPSARRMRGVPQRYPRGGYGDATLVGLPASVPDAVAGSPGFSPAAPVRVPSWGRPAGSAREVILASEYAATYRLAQRLTAGATSTYEAVRAIETHLRENYDYSPNAAQQTYPLASFLFAEQAGYCQHFSGAMALMLRMVGIPSRVVSGFAPGTYDAESDSYVVRDTDAHSWVEVYFPRIGWVTFDPTPSVAPAAAQTVELGGPVVVRRNGSTLDQGAGRRQDIEQAADGGVLPDPVAGGDGGSRFSILIIGAVMAAVLLGVVGGLTARRRRRLRSPAAAALQARELTRALERLGWELDRKVTLLAIERRFERAGRAGIADYARALRSSRFAAARGCPPGARERREMRRALTRGAGVRTRLRALRAVPPGGPS